MDRMILSQQLIGLSMALAVIIEGMQAQRDMGEHLSDDEQAGLINALRTIDAAAEALSAVAGQLREPR
jgi:hypothetical protein